MALNFIPVNVKEFEGSHYILLQSNRQTIKKASPIINYEDDVDVNGSSIVFKISRSMCPDFYNLIIGLEDKIVEIIKDLPNELCNQLPFRCQNVLNVHPEKFTSQYIKSLIRPNYFGDNGPDGDPVIYLRGNFSSLKIFNWSLEEVSKQSLKQGGEFMFCVRANMIYCGQHKNPMHGFNLQLRISEIIFRPTKTKNSC